MKATWLLAPVLVSALAVGQAYAMRAQGKPRVSSTAALITVDRALAENDVRGALRAWQDAYRAAQADRHPRGLLEVGHAYRRIGEVAGRPEPFDTKAREIYLSALFRARQAESVDGVLQAAEAFAALGDREVVAQAVRIAELLAARDAEARADVRAFVATFAPLLASARD